MSRITAREIRKLVCNTVEENYCFNQAGLRGQLPLIENISEGRWAQTIEGAAWDLELDSVWEFDSDEINVAETKIKECIYGDKAPLLQVILPLNTPNCIPDPLFDGPPFLGAKDSYLPKLREIIFNKTVWIPYHKPVLLKSRETLNIPTNMYAQLRPRTRTFRGLGELIISDVHPNFQGPIYALFTAQSRVGYTLEKGCRFAYAEFYYFKDKECETEYYEGYWQGDGMNQNSGKKIGSF